MDFSPEKIDRDASTPFLLKLFCRTGAFHRLDEFSSPVDLPPHISIHTWPTATLTELTHVVAAHSPHLLPDPSIGTRLAYRLLYHDTRGGPLSKSAPRLAIQDLGSVVIGDGGPGVASEPEDMDEGRLKEHLPVGSEAEARKTLADARFVVGDFLSVAILPPSPVDGSVQSATAAKMGRGYGAGQASMGLSGMSPQEGLGRERGFGYGRARGLESRMGGGGGGGGGMYGRGGGRAVPPVGEWRRGEMLPEPPPSRGRGRRHY